MDLNIENVLKELGVDSEEKMKKLAMAATISQMSKETAESLTELISLPIGETEREMCAIVFLAAYTFGRHDERAINGQNRETTEEDIENLKKFVEENNLN